MDFGTVGLAGVDGDVEIGTLDRLEGLDVFFGRKPVLAAREVEADDAHVAAADGEFGGFLGFFHVAHRADDQPPLNAVRCARRA